MSTLLLLLSAMFSTMTLAPPDSPDELQPPVATEKVFCCDKVSSGGNGSGTGCYIAKNDTDVDVCLIAGNDVLSCPDGGWVIQGGDNVTCTK